MRSTSFPKIYLMMDCKFCGSEKVVRAGTIYFGGRKQRWLCKNCGRTFTERRAKTLEEVARILRRRKDELRERFKVKRIGIFGSYLGGTQRTTSDIDILVEFSEQVGWEFVDLLLYLQDELGIRVDLVTPQALKEQMKEEVLKEVMFL